MWVASRHQLLKIKAENLNFPLKGEQIKLSDSVLNLGVHFDSDMKFKTHINKLYSKVHFTLSKINKVRSLLTHDSRHLLVNSLAFSKLNHAREVWGCLSREQNGLLTKLINFGAKVVYLRNKYAHASDLIVELGWLSPDKLSLYFLGLCAYKNLYQLNNPNVANAYEFIFRETRVTRHSNLPYVPASGTSYGDKRLIVRATHLVPRYT